MVGDLFMLVIAGVQWFFDATTVKVSPAGLSIAYAIWYLYRQRAGKRLDADFQRLGDMIASLEMSRHYADAKILKMEADIVRNWRDK